MASPERLNKLLAFELGVSRRQADDLIVAGKVLINGKIAQLGARVDLEADKIVVEDKIIDSTKTKQLIAVNKPVGVTCSRAHQAGDQTIYDILPEQFHALKLVGRLDKDSSGLILLTNDGQFAFEMTHPKFQKNKTYLITLDRPLEPLHQQMISDFGINLADGRSQMTITKLEASEVKASGIIYPSIKSQIYQVQISQGRNRQIRRTFAALGYTVTSLHRTHFGKYFISNLAEKHWREEQF